MKMDYIIFMEEDSPQIGFSVDNIDYILMQLDKEDNRNKRLVEFLEKIKEIAIKG